MTKTGKNTKIITDKVREKRTRVIKLLNGDEPVIDWSDGDITSKLIRAYSWYNVNYTLDEGREWFYNYLTLNNYSNADITKFKSVEIPMVVCSISRLLSRDIEVPARTYTFFKTFLQNTLSSKTKNEELKVKRSYTYVKLPSVDNKIEAIMQNIEDSIDAFHKTGSFNYSLYNDIKSYEIKSPSVQIIYTNLLPRIQQIVEAVDSPKSDIKEYFTSYTKGQFAKLVDFYRMLDTDCKKALLATKIIRKNRKKKTISSEKVLKSFKYQKEDKTLKTVSIDPSRIINSSTLVTFNTKYKRMAVFVAKEGEKLSVKGTSIINYDESKSGMKRVKKSEEAISSILSGTPNSILKTFSKLKNDSTVPTNRINEDTLLLRVV